jgi:hypothetical protein
VIKVIWIISYKRVRYYALYYIISDLGALIYMGLGIIGVSVYNVKGYRVLG